MHTGQSNSVNQKKSTSNLNSHVQVGSVMSRNP